jgi:dipeptidyl aminopeptidase/acylaminoacyl peptidase
VIEPAKLTRIAAELATVAGVGEWYRRYSVSPDGATVAFQWRRGGDWQIYLVPTSGGEPRRMASIDDACFCPLFSPDGRFVYFARDIGGSECYDFYRYELATGVFENLLVETPEFAPLPDFELSPDGGRIALSSALGQSNAAAIMPAAPCPGGAGVEFLVDHYYNDETPVWSPDGRLLAYQAGTEWQNFATFVVDPATCEERVVGGDPGFLAGDPAWSPDGRALAFRGGTWDRTAVGIYDLGSGATSWVWRGDADAHGPVWSPDGRALVFLADAEGRSSLRHVDLGTGAETLLDIGPGTHYDPQFAPDGSALFVVHSAAEHPPDLYRTATADGSVMRLTDSLPSSVRDVSFVFSTSVRCTSRDLLTEVPALIARPAQPNGAGVVYIHGGPDWHHADEWDATLQSLVAAGLTVASPNYRGSTGYGRRWQLANRFQLGQGEALDCAATHDLLVAAGCDPERIAVTGGSHGGFLTMAMLTQFPDLWACGVAVVPYFNLIDDEADPESVREDVLWWDRENVCGPETDRAGLRHFSPVSHLERIRAPLLMFAGSLDPRCPPTQVELVGRRLRDLGRACEVILYPNEGHAITGDESRRDLELRRLDFILRHTGSRDRAT